MSTYKENRRENLLALEKRFGSLEELSKVVGVSASYLSQMKKLRHMGDKVARRFEKKIGLPTGMMDLPPAATEQLRDGGAVKFAPHYAPDEGVQELLQTYLSLPPGLRRHIARRTKRLKDYVDALPQFQRNNFPEPPIEAEAYNAWRQELDAELDKAEELGRQHDEPMPPEPRKPRSKSKA